MKKHMDNSTKNRPYFSYLVDININFLSFRIYIAQNTCDAMYRYVYICIETCAYSFAYFKTVHKYIYVHICVSVCTHTHTFSKLFLKKLPKKNIAIFEY